MSDFILKFWPKEDAKEVKTERIKKGLISSNILGSETEYWGKPAYKAGVSLNDYLEPRLEEGDTYFDAIHITLSEKDYGVEAGEDDYIFFDRNNVVSIYGGDGTIEGWGKICSKLEEITGDEYVGDWEIL